jgi:hypothetical protein
MSHATILTMGGAVSTPVNLTTLGRVPGLDNAIDAIFPTRKRHIEEPSAAQLLSLQDTAVARKKPRPNPSGGESINYAGSPLDGFKTGLKRKPYLHTAITVPQRIVNQKKPYTRFVWRAPKGMPVLDTIAKYKFAFLKKTPLDARSTEFSKELGRVLNIPLDDGTTGTVDIRPQVLYEAAVLNSFLYRAQRAIFERSPEEFYALTAADIMNEWSFDGLVISEEMANGAESAQTSGFALRGGQWLGGDGVKVATINLSGEDLCANVFGAQVMHGSALYFVCKKYAVENGGFHFNLNAKGGASGFSIVHSEDPSAAMSVNARLRMIAGTEPEPRGVGRATAGGRGFFPWLIGFVSQPDDQRIALEHLAMTDEFGMRRYDAYQQYIGTTIIAPQGHESQPHVLDRITLNSNEESASSDLLVDVDPTGSLYASSASQLRPGAAVDSALGLDQPFIKIYMNPRGNNPLNG